VFTFPTPVLQGDTYNVTVAIQPANQFCSVTGGMGTVSGVVSGVQVACVIVEQLLYSFTGSSGDGASPHASLVMDTAGNFYGTTANGGTNNFGTVFKLAPNGSGGYVESIVYAFASGTDGDTPEAGLIIDSAGNLFGTTLGGGSDSFGTVFKLAPNGSGGFVESVLYSFPDLNSGGPFAGLIIDNAGNLYGTTGGYSTGSSSLGVAFKLAPSGSGSYTESVLYAFTGGSDGANSRAGLIMDSAGNLYGTTSGGGNSSINCNNGCGVVFKLAPDGSGATPNQSCTALPAATTDRSLRAASSLTAQAISTARPRRAAVLPTVPHSNWLPTEAAATPNPFCTVSRALTPRTAPVPQPVCSWTAQATSMAPRSWAASATAPCSSWLPMAAEVTLSRSYTRSAPVPTAQVLRPV
jgi:uncharacterized repeat protein (TIGR03803 family)